MEFNGKNIVIFGMGKSGIAVAEVLRNMGANILISDIKPKEQLEEEIKSIDGSNIKFEFGRHSIESVYGADIVIVSPGVPVDIPPIIEAEKKGIPVWSEVELAYRLISSPMIAVTGTNGKTTTVQLIGEILKLDGKKVRVAGNIGVPLMEIVDTKLDEIIVAEISSFQLQKIDSFRPYISVILNIAEDHLDRHKNFDEYIDSKKRIFKNQGKEDFVILNFDDLCLKKMEVKNVNILFFSKLETVDKGAFVKDGKIVFSLNGRQEEICGTDDIAMVGQHNLENALAGICVAKIYQVKNESIVSALKSFIPPEHRLSNIYEMNGLSFVDDSKATNPHATISALNSYNRPIILIAGGKDKGADFSELGKEISKRVKKLILIGETTEEIQSAAMNNGFNNISRANSMKDAVIKAFDASSYGDIILLSPACSSFDMFRDYKERGRVFAEAVNELRQKAS